MIDNTFEKTQGMTKDAKIKILKRISYLLIVVVLVGFTIGWTIWGVFGFLFVPFIFWDKIGKAINEYLTNKKDLE